MLGETIENKEKYRKTIKKMKMIMKNVIAMCAQNAHSDTLLYTLAKYGCNIESGT